MILLGLTGSIGMGKTTTARLFAEQGAPVYDSDAAVHALYAPGGGAVAAVAAAFPEAVRDGAVDRAKLGAAVLDDPAAMTRLEAIVHPMVEAGRLAFLETARLAGAPVAVLDIPLLFEIGGESLVHAVVVVSASAEAQAERVLARAGMTEAKLQAILARQVPDAEKRRRADFVVDTGSGVEVARDQVRRILKAVAAPGWKPSRPQGGPDGRSVS